MKRLIQYIILVAPLLILVSACQKKSLMTYDQEADGSSIYFLDKYKKTDNDRLMKQIFFASGSTSTTDTTIGIVVRTTGALFGVDRTYTIVASDTSSMVEGVHYDFLSEPVVDAGKIIDTLYLTLHRTSDLLERKFYLNLQLQPNENFNTNIATYENSYTQDILNYSFSIDDMLPVSYLWTYASKDLIIMYLGDYSRKKVELIMEVLNLEYDVFFDEDRAPTFAAISGWASYMKNWLLKQKNAGVIYYDENGNEITMGEEAQ